MAARKGSPVCAGVQVPCQLLEFERAIGAIDHEQRSLSLTRRHFCLPLPSFLDHVDFRQGDAPFISAALRQVGALAQGCSIGSDAHSRLACSA